MGGFSIGEIFGVLNLDSSKFIASLKESEGTLAEFTSALDKSAADVVAALGAELEGYRAIVQAQAQQLAALKAMTEDEIAEHNTVVAALKLREEAVLQLARETAAATKVGLQQEAAYRTSVNTERVVQETEYSNLVKQLRLEQTLAEKAYQSELAVLFAEERAQLEARILLSNQYAEAEVRTAAIRAAAEKEYQAIFDADAEARILLANQYADAEVRAAAIALAAQKEAQAIINAGIEARILLANQYMKAEIMAAGYANVGAGAAGGGANIAAGAAGSGLGSLGLRVGAGGVTPRGFIGAGSALLPAAAAAFATYELISITSESAKAARATQDLGVELNITWQQARHLQETAEITGVSINNLQSAERKIAEALDGTTAAGKKTAQVLLDMGATDLLSFLTQLGKIEDPMKRAAVAAEVMGKASNLILPYVDNLKAADEITKRLGQSLDEDGSAKLSALETHIAAASLAWSRFKDNLATGDPGTILGDIADSFAEFLANKDGNGEILGIPLPKPKPVPPTGPTLRYYGGTSTIDDFLSSSADAMGVQNTNANKLKAHAAEGDADAYAAQHARDLAAANKDAEERNQIAKIQLDANRNAVLAGLQLEENAIKQNEKLHGTSDEAALAAIYDINTRKLAAERAYEQALLDLETTTKSPVQNAQAAALDSKYVSLQDAENQKALFNEQDRINKQIEIEGKYIAERIVKELKFWDDVKEHAIKLNQEMADDRIKAQDIELSSARDHQNRLDEIKRSGLRQKLQRGDISQSQFDTQTNALDVAELTADREATRQKIANLDLIGAVNVHYASERATLIAQESRLEDQLAAKQAKDVSELSKLWLQASAQITSAIKTMVDTFSTDLVRIAFPSLFSNKDPLDPVIQSFRTAFEKLSTYTDPKAALVKLIQSIKDTGSAAAANAIAIQYFGDTAGPLLASEIRNGTLSANDIAAAIDKATLSTVAYGAATTSTISPLTQLWRDLVKEILVTLAKLLVTAALNAASLLLTGKTLTAALTALWKKLGDDIAQIFHKTRTDVNSDMDYIKQHAEEILRQLNNRVVNWYVVIHYSSVGNPGIDPGQPFPDPGLFLPGSGGGNIIPGTNISDNPGGIGDPFPPGVVANFARPRTNTGIFSRSTSGTSTVTSQDVNIGNLYVTTNNLDDLVRQLKAKRIALGIA